MTADGEASDEDFQALHLSSRSFLTEPPRRLGVAVSGGGDSMALLELMIRHGQDLGFPVAAVTVDHGLRAEAAAEAEAVAAFCRERGVSHDILRWHYEGTGNLQAAARDARYRLIADWAAGAGVDRVALGHTRDDQAETFLMRLGRAAGVDGLAEMRRRFERHGVIWLRPLLSLGREELRAYLRRRGIGWCEDPSNEDPRFDRVKARKALEALAPLGIGAEVLAAVSANLAMARGALAHFTRAEAARIVAEDGGDLILSQSPRPPVHPEIARRLLAAALHYVSGAAYPPRQSAMVELDAALTTSDSATLHGCLVTRGRDGDTLRIAREWAAVRAIECPAGEIWDGRWHLSGPERSGLTLRALGEAGLKHCPDWRATGLPRASLLAAPAVWDGAHLVAAPLAGLSNGWTASLRPTFTAFLDSH